MIHQPITRPAVVERFLLDMNRMAFDGFHQHDPNAPAVFRCYGCDAYRKRALAHCPNCAEVTASYL